MASLQKSKEMIHIAKPKKKGQHLPLTSTNPQGPFIPCVLHCSFQAQ
jgi:hypothetical protein